MTSKNDRDPEDRPWFQRYLSDRRREPHAARGDNGEILIIDGDGCAVSFKDGVWHDGIVWRFAEQIAEFTPVEKRDEFYPIVPSSTHCAWGEGQDRYLKVASPSEPIHVLY